MDALLDSDFDGPLSERELDALDAVWKPITLLVSDFLGETFAMNSLARYLEWRDRVNARRGDGYADGPDPYDDA